MIGYEEIDLPASNSVPNRHLIHCLVTFKSQNNELFSFEEYILDTHAGKQLS
jgi:hypothetical protein